MGFSILAASWIWVRGCAVAESDIASFLRAGLLGPRHRSQHGLRGITAGDVKVLAPLGRGLRYFCIGVNYPDRNEEYKDAASAPSTRASSRAPHVFCRSRRACGSPTRIRAARLRRGDRHRHRQRRRRIPEAMRCRTSRVLLRERRLGAGLAASLQIQRDAGKELRSLGLDRPVSGDCG